MTWSLLGIFLLHHIVDFFTTINYDREKQAIVALRRLLFNSLGLRIVFEQIHQRVSCKALVQPVAILTVCVQMKPMNRRTRVVVFLASVSFALFGCQRIDHMARQAEAEKSRTEKTAAKDSAGSAKSSIALTNPGADGSVDQELSIRETRGDTPKDSIEVEPTDGNGPAKPSASNSNSAEEPGEVDNAPELNADAQESDSVNDSSNQDPGIDRDGATLLSEIESSDMPDTNSPILDERNDTSKTDKIAANDLERTEDPDSNAESSVGQRGNSHTPISEKAESLSAGPTARTSGIGIVESSATAQSKESRRNRIDCSRFGSIGDNV